MLTTALQRGLFLPPFYQWGLWSVTMERLAQEVPGIQVEACCLCYAESWSFLKDSFFFNFHVFPTRPCLDLQPSQLQLCKEWCLHSHWKKWQATNRHKYQFLHSYQHLVLRCLTRRLILGCWEERAEIFFPFFWEGGGTLLNKSIMLASWTIPRSNEVRGHSEELQAWGVSPENQCLRGVFSSEPQHPFPLTSTGVWAHILAVASKSLFLPRTSY